MSVADLSADAGIPVTMPTGSEFLVLTDAEREFVEERVRRYEEELAFETASDQAELDRIIAMELLSHRYSLYLSRGLDYHGEEIDEIDIRRSLKEISGEIRLIKKSLGVDKLTRDKTKGSESVSSYLEELRRRARAFGYNRNAMFQKGLILSQQLIALIQFYDNCDAEERKEQHRTEADVIEWIRDVFIPEFQAVDAEFRATQQTLWIKEM